MSQTNGQDQSAAFMRDLGHQGFGQDGGKSFLPVPGKEERERGRLQLRSRSSSVSMLESHKITLLKQQSALNVWVGIHRRTERKNDPAKLSEVSPKKPTGLAEGYRKVCERWSLDAPAVAKLLHLENEIGLSDLILSGQIPPITGDLKDRMALVIGISIGLGDLFDDDENAELQWLNSKRAELNGVSSQEHMLKGDLLNIRDVLDLVDNARGLK